MEKLKNIDAFMNLQGRLMASRDPGRTTIVINAGTCGQASGANDLIRVAKREVMNKGLSDQLGIRITGCHGYCEMEPSVLIEPMGTFYPKVTMERMVRIMDAASRGEVIEDFLYEDPASGGKIRNQEDIPFFRKQHRTLMARNERIDPIRIYNYIEQRGYGAYVKVLQDGQPGEVIRQVAESGIRGRGGAGFPTGKKWEYLAAQPSDRGKFLVCNADEGDPGAYMDRSLLEGNPHSIIEGMGIGAYGTGATEGVIYVRNEYPLAIKHLKIALRQARELGLLGEDILGTGFSFDIQLVRGAGAFVCGEETALMRSVEGRIGEPRQRPPFPVQKGILGRPTAINNVETWANIPVILGEGAHKFAQTGTKGSTGTKIFSLVGKVKNTGLAEVPMGVTVGEIVYGIGGGPEGNTKIKAVQTGGPSGGCIPARKFDLSIDYDSLARAGSIMGSGGMIVMDENTCMVDVAKYYMNFLKDESCGKCFTCRKGTQRMYEILEDITEGRGTEEQLDLLEELALAVKDTTMCGLGQTAPNPVLSTLKYFREEYLQHIHQKRCPAGVCKQLVGAPCHSTCPIGTEAWKYIAHIAREEYDEAYLTIRETNPFPSVCARVCNHPCEEKCRAGQGGQDPVAIRSLKRFVTERVDPSIYKPAIRSRNGDALPPVAVIGAGPAGMTAAHFLSLRGIEVTVFEAEDRPGGMLYSAIPSYRLPREVIEREIRSLLNENIEMKYGHVLGRDVTIDGLFDQGFKAVFVALGAHRSLDLKIEGEESEGVIPSITFLKAFNMRGESMARGHVGVIGGGNSAVDAARVAVRQKGVESVTILYRRTREEMPAYQEEIEAAIQEGVRVETLVTPQRILSENGKLQGVRCMRNRLGDTDQSGRRRPVPIAGSEFGLKLDTLIVAISESSDTDCLTAAQASRIETRTNGTVVVDAHTLATNRPGVFAGGDIVTGPNTVVDAIAAGKRAALMMERYLEGKDLKAPVEKILPSVYVAPPENAADASEPIPRTELPRAPVEWRKRGFAEVEMAFSEEEALRETRRCLRCDLEFTKDQAGEGDKEALGGEGA